MAPNTEPGGYRESDRIRAAKINRIAVIAAAIISALALVGIALLQIKSHSGASAASYNPH